MTNESRLRDNLDSIALVIEQIEAEAPSGETIADAEATMSIISGLAYDARDDADALRRCAELRRRLEVLR